MRLSRFLVPLVTALALACGGKDPATVPVGGGSDGGGSTSNAIEVGNNFYSPNLTTLPVGTTVTWTWNGGGNHDVTFATGNVKSPTQSSGTYQRTFSQAGTYDYHCSVHGASMSGRVVIQ